MERSQVLVFRRADVNDSEAGRLKHQTLNRQTLNQGGPQGLKHVRVRSRMVHIRDLTYRSTRKTEGLGLGG